MSTDNTYNGWSNYETWAVALWMDNEKGSADHWRARAKELLAKAKPTLGMTADRVAVYELAYEIRESHTENMPEVEGVYGDMLSASFSSVDWREIAEHCMADVEVQA